MKDTSIEENHEMLKKIETGMTSISYYLGYLMQYNLIQEEGIELQLEPLNIFELLKEELFIYYEKFQENVLVLTATIEENEWAISDVTVKSTKKKLLLSFKNGFEEDLMDETQLFHRFVTEDKSRTNKSKGLGLAIVNELVALIHAKAHISTTNKEFELKIQMDKYQRK